jgi:hypothetical protein
VHGALTVLAVQPFFTTVLLLKRHKQWLVVSYSRHPPCVGSAGIHDCGAAQVKADSLDGTHRAANSSGGSAILHYSHKK